MNRKLICNDDQSGCNNKHKRLRQHEPADPYYDGARPRRTRNAITATVNSSRRGVPPPRTRSISNLGKDDGLEYQLQCVFVHATASQDSEGMERLRASADDLQAVLAD